MLIGVLSYPTINQVYTNTLGSKIIETLPDFDFSLCELLFFHVTSSTFSYFLFLMGWLQNIPENSKCQTMYVDFNVWGEQGHIFSPP